MKRRESTGSARSRRKSLKKKTSNLKIAKEKPNIVESVLGKDIIERDPYKDKSLESFEVYWGALSHPETNVMKLLTQITETVAPVKYPTEDMMEKLALRMVKVQGISPPTERVGPLPCFPWITSNTCTYH